MSLDDQEGLEEFFAGSADCSIRKLGTRPSSSMVGAVTATIRSINAGKTENQEELAKRVKALKDNTTSAFSFAQQREPVFVALQYIAHRYGIPAHYALELIEGMAMDVRGTRYGTLKELLTLLLSGCRHRRTDDVPRHGLARREGTETRG